MTAREFIKKEEGEVQAPHSHWGTAHLTYVMDRYALQVAGMAVEKEMKVRYAYDPSRGNQRAICHRIISHIKQKLSE